MERHILILGGAAVTAIVYAVAGARYLLRVLGGEQQAPRSASMSGARADWNGRAPTDHPGYQVGRRA